MKILVRFNIIINRCGAEFITVYTTCLPLLLYSNKVNLIINESESLFGTASKRNKTGRYIYIAYPTRYRELGCSTVIH